MFQSDFSVLDHDGHFISISPSDLVSLYVTLSTPYSIKGIQI